MPRVNIDDYACDDYNPYAKESMKRRGNNTKEGGRREVNKHERALQDLKNTKKGIQRAMSGKEKY